ncbi:DUF6519 domain-containing protein [Sorangium sp. So ce260]|uniref:DUF6519 domain-containing protein n=1 Tax=Sorangium sp. So ce260 TaxID=3133291 RepID=UPI003F5E83E1
MKGNFSRLTRARLRREFSTVLLQQGRVLLDSDWNDLVEILERELRVRTRMIVGEAGGPEHDEGFELRFACGVDLNGGGQRDRQYDQSVVLRRRPSLPFREASADLPYTLKLDFIVPEADFCGEWPRAALVGVPGRYTIYLESDRCLALYGPDDRLLSKLGKVDAERRETLCVSYDGGRRLRVWTYASPLKKRPRCDEIECPAWEERNPAPSRFSVTIAASHRADSYLHCTLAGLWIWDTEIEAGTEPGRQDRSASGCQLVCALDLCHIEPRPELFDAIIHDTSGASNHGQIHLRHHDEKSLPPVRLLGVEIGPGQYVVSGLDAVNTRAIELGDQPWDDGALPSTGSSAQVAYLFYLQVWERFVTGLQYPEIVEPALGGPDTTARTQTIWQVRALIARDAGDVEARWNALLARRELPGLARIFRPTGEVGRAGNRLYRVEVHHPGWAQAEEPTQASSSPITIDRVSSNAITVEDPDIAGMLALDSPVALWSERSRQKHILTFVTCVEGGRRFELATLPDSVSEEWRLQPVATFKWSRSNGCVAFPVSDVMPAEPDRDALTGGEGARHRAWTFTLANAGYNGFEVQAKDWLELVNDESDLARRGGLFFQIAAIDVNQLVITATCKRALEKIELGTNPILRRWDVSAETTPHLPPPLRPVAGSRLLEQAIHVGFHGGGFYAGGDWWVAPVRDEVGDGVLWPGGSPLPPQGIVLNEAKLASLRLGLGKSKSHDLRRKFAPLTELTRQLGSAHGGAAEDPSKPDIAERIDRLLNQTWSGRARILAEGEGDLPGLERTGVTVEGRCLTTEGWRSVDASDAPRGPGVALLWQKRPVFLGDSALRLDELGAWRPLASFPKRVDFAAAACGSRLWLFGGLDISARDSRTVADIEVLDAQSPTAWQRIDGATLDPPAVGLAAVTLAGRIHLLGGVTAEGTQRTHRVFDPRTLGFTSAADMLIPRKNFALVVHEGLIYAIGGCNPSGAYLTSVECYDPDSNTWSMLPPAAGSPEPDPLTDLAAVSVAEGIVVAGGFDGRTRTETWLFRPDLRRWQALAHLGTGRSRHGLVATAAWSEPDTLAVYAVGGEDDRKAPVQVEALPLTRRFHVLRAGGG